MTAIVAVAPASRDGTAGKTRPHMRKTWFGAPRGGPRAHQLDQWRGSFRLAHDMKINVPLPLCRASDGSYLAPHVSTSAPANVLLV